MPRQRKTVSGQLPVGGAVNPTVTIQKSGTNMGRLRRFHFCRSRLGSIFMVVIVVSLALFALNYFQGFSHSSIARDNDYDVAPPGESWNLKDHLPGHKGRRKKFHFDDEDDDPQICKVPKLSLDSDANQDAFFKLPPLDCESSNLMYIKNGHLFINETVLQGRKLERCEYRVVEWAGDFFTTYAEPIIRTEEPFTMKVTHDFYRVQCYLVKPPGEKTGGSMARKLLQDEGDKDLPLAGAPNLELRAKTFEKLKQYKPRNAASPETDVAKMHKSGNPEEHETADHKDQPRMLGSMGLPDPPVLDSQKLRVKSGEDNARYGKQVPVLARSGNVEAAGKDREGVARLAGKHKVEGDVPQRLLQDEQVQHGQNEAENKALEESAEIRRKKDDKHVVNDVDVDVDEDGDTDYYHMGDGSNEFGDFGDEDASDFDQFVAQVYPKESVFERLREMKPNPHSLQMNVLILAMDSMSHLSYQRKMPLTYRYLQDEMDAVILNGYNIVGDATTAAMIPLLTGKNESQLPEVRKSVIGSTFVDSYPLIWNKFEQNGYVTMYAEDDPAISTFNLRLNGFEQEPTDHYMRPFWLSSQSSNLYRFKSQPYCLGGMPKHKYSLNYVRQFFMRYKDHPKFALLFMNILSHNDNNPAQYADGDTVKLLEFLRRTKNLDNTLLIVMGDHGARYSTVRHTIQGKMEERLPMMSFAFPPWFEKKHAHLMRNLRRNVDRLTTPYDVYATIRNLLFFRNMENVEVDHSSRGISLLKEVPLNRTCKSAQIDMHWCTCMQWKEIKHDSYDIKKSVAATVDYINRLTEQYRDQCEKLTLKNIIEAKLIMPNEKVLTFLKSLDPDSRIANFSSIDEVKLDIVHYQIILETSPNDAMYEATILADHNTGMYLLTEEPSRLNIYGKQPLCLQDKRPELRKYCLCKHTSKLLKTKHAKRRKAKKPL